MKTQANERIKKKGLVVPEICPKCGKGKFERICDGRVYACDNPRCKAHIWVNLK